MPSSSSSSSSSSTHPSTTDSSSREMKKNEWLEASDWDNPHQVARFYQDATLTHCGHALQWDPIHLVDAKQCPVCQTPIQYIVQGTIDIPTMTVTSTSTSSSPTTTNVIKFQFGKKIFWISQQSSPTNDPPNKVIDDKHNNNNNSWIKRIVNGQWTSSATHSSSTSIDNNSNNNNNHTAQDCIQSALGLMNGFKILHRGKVLYPPPSSSTKKSSSKMKPTRQQDDDDGVDPNGTTTTTTTSTTISQRILQLSQQPGETIVVMGTLRGRELVEGPSSTTQSSSSSGGWWSSSQRWIQLPYTIVYHGTISVWFFIKSFLAPFLPSFLLGEQDRRMHHD